MTPTDGESESNPDAPKMKGVGQLFGAPGSASEVPALIVPIEDPDAAPGAAPGPPPAQTVPAWMDGLLTPS